jgi:hypothetical protein
MKGDRFALGARAATQWRILNNPGAWQIKTIAGIIETLG